MNDISNMSDHDLLITMHEQIKGIKNDIKDLKDGTSTTLADHENRLRVVEVGNTQTRTWGSVIIIAIGILEFLLIKFIH